MIFFSLLLFLHQSLGSPHAKHRLEERQTPALQATDPYDFNWISSYSALGDSYAAGLGAGHVIKAANNVS
jgi:hypothetical protein